MSILVIQLGPRPRLRVRGAAVAGPAAGDVLSQRGDYAYALSADGLGVASHGVCPAALLPRADTVVLVVADADIAWHRIMLPRAPAARLRAALASMLEDALLDEPEQVHLALAPAAVAGTATWVAVVQRAGCRTSWRRSTRRRCSSTASFPPAGPRSRRRAISSTPPTQRARRRVHCGWSGRMPTAWPCCRCTAGWRAACSPAAPTATAWRCRSMRAGPPHPTPPPPPNAGSMRR